VSLRRQCSTASPHSVERAQNPAPQTSGPRRIQNASRLQRRISASHASCGIARPIDKRGSSTSRQTSPPGVSNGALSEKSPSPLIPVDTPRPAILVMSSTHGSALPHRRDVFKNRTLSRIALDLPKKIFPRLNFRGCTARSGTAVFPGRDAPGDAVLLCRPRVSPDDQRKFFCQIATRSSGRACRIFAFDRAASARARSRRTHRPAARREGRPFVKRPE